MGRPKQLKGKVVNFNTKIEEDLKLTIDAIIKVGAYESGREMLEDWAKKYMRDNPEKAKQIETFKDMMKSFKTN